MLRPAFMRLNPAGALRREQISTSDFCIVVGGTSFYRWRNETLV